MALVVLWLGVLPLALLSAAVGGRAPLYDGAPGDVVLPDEYIVVLAAGDAAPVRLVSALWRASSAPHQEVEFLRDYSLGPRAMSLVRCPRDVIDSLRQLNAVSYVEVNRRVALTDVSNVTVITNVTDVSERTMAGDVTSAACSAQDSGNALWGLSRISTRRRPDDFSEEQYEFSDVDSGAGVDVYVVDTGVDVEHQEFEGRASRGLTADGVQHEGPDDLSGHGTHVAGTVAGRRYGVAKRANVVSVKVLDAQGAGFLSDVIQAVEWVMSREEALRGEPGRRGAVVNLSLGTSTVSYVLDAAVEALIASGVHVVVAAGNDASDACDASPARVAEAITVAASGRRDTLAAFSNYGPCVDVLAPGEDILSAGPVAPGRVVSGTSQAAPHVSGAVARYLSSPGSTPPADHVVNTATVDVIDFRTSHATTPNKLLYVSCDPHQHAASAAAIQPAVSVLSLLVLFTATAAV